MMAIRAVFWHITLLHVITLSMESCFSPNKGDRYYDTLECSNLTTSVAIPIKTPTRYNYWVRILSIRNSSFTTLQANSLESEYVTKITISDTDLTTIEPSGFNNIPKLEELRLPNNNITTITKGVFNHLSSLKILDLSNNSIRYIEKHSFLGTRIVWLYLDRNGIEDITPILESCATYKTLRLDFNAIENVSSLRNCSSLQTLNISGNNIDHLAGNLFPNALLVLNLGGNQIESVELETFAGLTKLHTLDLSGNKLYKLSDGGVSLGLLQPLQGLKSLNLSGNQLSNLFLGTFTKLTLLSTLDLSNNNLTRLSPGLLLHLPLSFLSIRQNYLSELDNNLVNAKRPITLEIDDNLWNCDYLSQKIHHILSQHIGNRIINGHRTNTSNINGIGCNESKIDEKSGSVSQYHIEMEASQASFDSLDSHQQETNNILADMKDLLQKIFARQNIEPSSNTSNTNVDKHVYSNFDNDSNRVLADLLSNMTETIKESFQKIRNISQTADQNRTDSKPVIGYQMNSELIEIRVVLIMLLLAVITLIVIKAAIFVLTVYKSKRCSQNRVPQDTLLDTYSM